MKKSLIAAFLVSTLAGCSTMGANDAAHADRNAWANDINTRCTEVGKDFTQAGYAVDKVSQAIISLTERQCGVINSYQTISKKHAEITGFMAANEDLDEEGLKAAIAEFDASKPANKKIGPQIKAYEEAQDEIFMENIQLAADLALQSYEITMIASENSMAILQHTVLSQFSSETETLPVIEAYYEMEDRALLIKDAQFLINEGKALIERIEDIDNIISESVAS
ncbi:hypothetical protein LRP49_06335 [Enterovibrio sp. ZSDZ35]|uniref:DUF3053 domain-containing protein n=1 Tax=Enterovibrio qingdaonensis TaxID=2899818 RepID=A0ABT5QIK6_9GAMM|nr:hypothetical protein [Enterovibrio sp. ZSDZ35]MDD1780816.1 hypothetical protein [Enterovibrio sp. ZSDZ35]